MLATIIDIAEFLTRLARGLRSFVAGFEGDSLDETRARP